jgi:hypothetical protein
MKKHFVFLVLLLCTISQNLFSQFNYSGTEVNRPDYVPDHEVETVLKTKPGFFRSLAIGLEAGTKPISVNKGDLSLLILDNASINSQLQSTTVLKDFSSAKSFGIAIETQTKYQLVWQMGANFYSNSSLAKSQLWSTGVGYIFSRNKLSIIPTVALGMGESIFTLAEPTILSKNTVVINKTSFTKEAMSITCSNQFELWSPSLALDYQVFNNCSLRAKVAYNIIKRRGNDQLSIKGKATKESTTNELFDVTEKLVFTHDQLVVTKNGVESAANNNGFLLGKNTLQTSLGIYFNIFSR